MVDNSDRGDSKAKGAYEHTYFAHIITIQSHLHQDSPSFHRKSVDIAGREQDRL